MFISFTYHSPHWRSRARTVGGQVWGPSVLLPSCFAFSTHSCHLMIQMAAPAPASMSAFQPERRGKGDGAGHAPRSFRAQPGNCAPFLITYDRSEHSHMTSLAAKEPGKCSFHFGWPCVQEGRRQD